MLPEGNIFLRLLMLNTLVRDINYLAYSGQVLIILGLGWGLLVCNVIIFVQSMSPCHEENS